MILSIFIALIVSFLFYRKTLPEISKKRKYILFFLRAVVIYTILILLFNPILYFRKGFNDRPVFLILSDKSNSMSQIIEGKTKTEHLSRFETDMRRIASNNNYAVENINLFVNNPRASVLLDEISDVLHSGKEIAGIALASDGWFQDNQSLFRELLNIPIYTFNPELETNNAELTITNITYNQNVSVNELQTIRVSFTTQNFEGDVQATLKHEGRVLQSRNATILTSQSEIGTTLTSQTEMTGYFTSFRGGTTMEGANRSELRTPNSELHFIDFEYSFSETGLKVFEIEISGNAMPPQPANDTLVNDIIFGAVQVLDDKAKILILTDSFSWDVRVFNRYLNFNDRFDIELVYLQNRVFRQH